MPYVLGEVAAPVKWVSKNTLENDSLDSLAFAYGTTAREIAAQNGVKWSTPSIQDWVISKGGKLLAYNSKSHPFSSGPRAKEGWAVFTAKSKIKLPDIARKDGKDRVPADKAPPAGERELPDTLLTPVSLNEKPWHKRIDWVRTGMLFAAIAGVGLIIREKQKAKKKSAPAPVIF